MRTSMKRFAGMVIVLIGIMIFINSLNVHTAIVRFILPLIFTGIGLYFYQRSSRVLAGVFIGIAIVLFLNINLFALFIAAVMMYFGYNMLKKQNTNDKKHEPSPNSEDSIENHVTDSSARRSLFGEFHMMNDRYELEDLTISHGIGDVKIDLTKAIIPAGETVLVVSGWIGDIDIYVPYDLDVSINASVTIGELEVFGNKQSGISRSLSKRTESYTSAEKKVKLILSLTIGDIDVRYL
ncbi:cell wall-active antibiotics response protein LiaF [Pueribacillus theae]|nr:cell wall-active antibiotics response protein LiaF [Pueribacillus theae]